MAHEHPDYRKAMMRAGRLYDRFREPFHNLKCGDVKTTVGRVTINEDNRVDTLENIKDDAKAR